MSAPLNSPSPWLSRIGLLILGLGAFGLAYVLASRPTGPRISQQPTSPEGMVWIDGGEFRMGTDAEDAWRDEKPSHRVRIDGFWIDATEVTSVCTGRATMKWDCDCS